MMKTTILIMITLFIPLLLLSQAIGEIKGKVIATDDPLGIIGAHVYVEIAGEKIGAITDSNGKFTIKPLNPGLYNLFVTYTGYKEWTMTDVSVKPDKITFIDDIEIVKGIEIDGGIVFAFKNKIIDVEEPSKMTILGPELQKLPDIGNLPMLLRTLSSEIKVSEDGKDIHFRGARSGTSAFYVDGVKRESLSNALPGNAIGSITVYTGGVPAKYGDLTGGVVVIETKSYFDYLNAWRAEQLRRKNKHNEKSE